VAACCGALGFEWCSSSSSAGERNERHTQSAMAAEDGGAWGEAAVKAMARSTGTLMVSRVLLFVRCSLRSPGPHGGRARERERGRALWRSNGSLACYRAISWSGALVLVHTSMRTKMMVAMIVVSESADLSI